MSNSTSNHLANYYKTTENCTSVSLQCPVEATVYGYYPSLGANAFFCAYFASFTVVNLILAFRYKTWVFGRFVSLGCLSEMIGYIGRIILHSNPWSNVGFEIQICTLIFAPVSLFHLLDFKHKLMEFCKSLSLQRRYTSHSNTWSARSAPNTHPSKPPFTPGSS